MSDNNFYNMTQSLCKKCFIKLAKPSKKTIKSIVLTDYEETCEHCGKVGPIVDYIEDGD